MDDRELESIDGWAPVSKVPSNPGTLTTRDLARGYANGCAAVLERSDTKFEYGYQVHQHGDFYDVTFFKRARHPELTDNVR